MYRFWNFYRIRVNSSDEAIEEFQKYHDEIQALRSAGNAEEFARRFAAKGAVFISPLHEPAFALESFKIEPGKLSNMPVENKIEEIVQLGDVVIDRSSIVAKLPTEDKKGWNLSVWVKEDGQWKIRSSCATFLQNQ